MLRVDFHDISTGAKLDSPPVTDVISFKYRQALDKIGSYELLVPQNAATMAAFQLGREIRVYRDGEGLLWRGVVESREGSQTPGADRAVSVRGQSIMRKLVRKNTKPNLEFEAATPADVVTSLLASSGISSGTVGTSTLTYEGAFQGMSAWDALVRCAKTFDMHVREDVINAEVDFADLGTVLSVRVENAAGSGSVRPITEMKWVEEISEIINYIIPFGQGEGIQALSLQRSTRTSPYTIQSATGPDGRTYYYLADSTSITAYGQCEKVIRFNAIAPLSNTKADIRAAANALYDVSKQLLRKLKDPVELYECQATGFVANEFQVGDKIQVRYADEFLTVDKDLWVMGYDRTLTSGGQDTWKLQLATRDKKPKLADELGAEIFESLYDLSSAIKPFMYTDSWNRRDSVDSGKPITIIVDFWANIQYLHEAELSVTIRPVRSNATGAATAAADAETTAGGSAHGHNVNGTTAQSGDNHGHAPSVSGSSFIKTVGQESSSTSHSHNENKAASYTQNVLTDPNSTPHGHTTTTDSAVVGVGIPQESGHTHPVSATTTQNESTHSHGFTIPAHSHGQSYGIFEGSTANDPDVNVIINGTNRTVALGGPFDVSFYDKKIGQYLVDADGHVLQQNNTIQFTTDQLCDLDIVVKALLTSSAVAPA